MAQRSCDLMPVSIPACPWGQRVSMRHCRIQVASQIKTFVKLSSDDDNPEEGKALRLAASRRRQFQDLNTRPKYVFRSVWPDEARRRTLSKVAQSFRTNFIRFRGDEAPISLPPSAKGRIDKRNYGGRTGCQSECEWPLRRNWGSADLA